MPHTRDAQQPIDLEHAPFFLLLERLGRRVLRPGGRVATGRLLDGLGIGGDDDVVELAAGVGATAAEVLARGPRSYTAVEPEERFVPRLVRAAGEGTMRHVPASARETGLDDGCADVVIGEAILTMQGDEARRAIVREAARLLRPGGRYGIHELATLVDDPAGVRAVQRDLSQVVRVAARPVPVDDWCAVLRDAGLEVVEVERFPLRLLTLRGLVDDEGVRGAMRVLGRVVRWPAARRRVRRARRVHREHRASLAAVVVIARRPPDGEAPEADGAAPTVRVGDAMVAAPKTIPADGTVRDLRTAFDNPHVVTALLVDGTAFAGTVDRDALPADVADDRPLRGLARTDLPTVTPDTPLPDAAALLEATGRRRLVVLDHDGRTLRGLLCLTEDRARFCRR